MCSDAANGEYEGFKFDNEIGCSWEGEATTSESILDLDDILEMLIRLDQQGIFMNPVDESVAPDYSKVIKNPMCFVKMREKIHAEQYVSWHSFVEDFECICQNAMKYNRKRSKIWNAANLMLRQGKKCLQQFSRHNITLGLRKPHTGCDHLEENVAEVKLDSTELDEHTFEGLGEQIYVTADDNLALNNGGREDQMTTEENLQVSELDGWEQHVVSCSPAKSLSEDGSIEILESVPGEDFRVTIDDQATECSSSFSSTQSDLEDETCEVDSECRDGNGAITATEDVSVTSRRRKRALDADWKMYREGIEWRCRWLVLRIQRLQAESNKYKEILEAAESRKWQHKEDGSAARTSVTSIHAPQCRVLRRRKRRRAEESLDSMLQMSLHPVFSRYEKQKQRTQEMSTQEGLRDESQQILAFDNFDFDFDNHYEDNIVLEKDSYEQCLWQIEALQMRMLNLKDLLIWGPELPENPTKQFSELEVPESTGGPVSGHSPHGLGGRSSGRESKGHGGTPSSRRRNSDFDINNVIMPDSVMANFIEPVRHSFIETPQWRLKSVAVVEDEAESSDEDTDDEVYIARHSQMQAKERHQEYSPKSLLKSRTLSTAKERPRSGKIGRGLVANANIDGELLDDGLGFPASLGYIPKRKRRKRQSRKTAIHTDTEILNPNSDIPET